MEIETNTETIEEEYIIDLRYDKEKLIIIYTNILQG